MKSSILCLLAPVVLLSSCANPGVVQISPDTYELSRSSAAGAFTNTSMLKAGVIREANLFAQKQGKVAVPLAINESRPSVGFPSCEVTFMVMSLEEYERQKEAHRKEWNSLTPAQRAEYTLRTQDIAQRDRAVSSEERQSTNASFNNAMNRNSYDQRTRTLQQPVNVNVNGNVNHNINGRLDVYGY